MDAETLVAKIRAAAHTLHADTEVIEILHVRASLLAVAEIVERDGPHVEATRKA